MALEPGSKLGPYDILGPLGAGGMGEVYRARDPKLSREVAIKVLPSEVARDPERLSRFRREATLLAALNHPHVAAIHGLEESDGSPFLVLELVEGEDLAERLKRGPIPIGEALEIGRQIAEALEEAHEKGIVHRDLKPANVKLTPGGKVKVLDFGLAKAYAGDAAASGVASDLTQSPTLARSGTAAGVILGTASYMSPEQARGRPVDKRADIWSFGVVLFEMLTGRQLFTGATVSDVLAAVLKTDPDWGQLPESTPAGARRLVRRCLERETRQRLRDIGIARWELDKAGDVDASTAVGLSQRSRMGIAALAALALLASGVALWSLSRGSDPPPSYRLSIPLPEGHALQSGPVLSHDGQLVAFTSSDGVGPAGLYVRSLTDDALRRLPGTEGAWHPFFSPDGRSLGFFAKGGLWRTSSDGGTPLRLADAPGGSGGTWGEDDSIVFLPTWNSGLYRVRAAGGDPELLLRPATETEYACVFPRLLPGGRELLFTTWGGQAGSTISRLSLPGLERTVMARAPTGGIFVAPGFLVFGDGQGGIQAQPYEQQPGAELPVPTSVLPSIDISKPDNLPRIDVARNGTLAYAPGDSSQVRLSRVDFTGRATPTSFPRRHYRNFAASRDGRRLAVAYGGDVWIQDLERGSATPLVPERGLSATERAPLWTPDGERIVFGSNRDGDWDIYERDASGVGPITRVLEKELDQIPHSIAADGTLAFTETHPGTAVDIWILSPDGAAEVWLATVAQERSPQFSPDGRWLAFSSDQSGRHEVYIQALTDGQRVQVSASGGASPAWSNDGSRLFFRRGHEVLSAAVTLAPRLEVGQPEVLFDGGWALDTGGFEVAPNGTELLMLQLEPEAISERIDLIFNFAEELRKHVEPGDRP